mgnify:CR=1 FL=1|nr:c-type cytochrome biogenesis protein CcmI [uncultured Acidocella sp.]
MILIYMALLALAFSLPLLLTLRAPRNLPERRDAALALHRAQLVELERDLADGRISRAEHDGARLEIERRVLAADAFPATAKGGSAKVLLIVATLALPLGAFSLYLPDATWNVPSEPHAKWLAQQESAQAKLAQLIALLRAHLASVQPGTADASQGEAYLAEALSEQAGAITPEALGLFKQSLASAPANATWRQLDQQRIMQAGVQPGQ